MASMGMGGMGNLGYLGLGIDRMESSLPAGMYDPNQFINPALLPYMGMYMQPQMMRTMANFQNPELMLPQNTGSFLAGALGRMFGQGYSPQAQSSQGQQGSPQQQQDPTQALDQQMGVLTQRGLQQGMGYGQAQARAVTQLAQLPQYQNATSQAMLSRYMQNAQKNGYDPKIPQQEGYNYMNFQNVDSGQRATFSAQEFANMDPKDRAQWIRAENLPQIAPGRIQEFKRNGLYYAVQANPNGGFSLIGKSSTPEQFIRSQAITVDGDDIEKYPGLLTAITTGSAADVTREKVAQQQVHVQNFDNITGDIQGLLVSGASGGTAGDIFEKVDNTIATVGKVADAVGDTTAFNKLVLNSHSGMNDMAGLVSRFKLSGTQAAKLNTALNAAAYEWWRSNNPEGNLTPKALTEARDEILGDNADPNTMLAQLQEAQRIMHGNLSNSQRVMGVTPFGGTGAPSQAPRGAPSAPSSQVPPADIQALIDQYAPGP